jgi:hypothetical protein
MRTFATGPKRSGRGLIRRQCFAIVDPSLGLRCGIGFAFG